MGMMDLVIFGVFVMHVVVGVVSKEGLVFLHAGVECLCPVCILLLS